MSLIIIPTKHDTAMVYGIWTADLIIKVDTEIKSLEILGLNTD